MRTQTATAKGFTLLELMTAIAVMAVLLSVGVPSFIQIIRNNRITAQTNEMVAALNIARSESIKRGIPVSVCSSTDSATCAGSGTWGTGWIVFTDAGAAGQVNAGDEVLQVWPGVQGGLQLNSVAGTAPVSPVRNFVQYTSTGMDAIATYEYVVNGGSVDITVTSDYAAGSLIQHLGYVISGTDRDGIYFEVRDHDTATVNDPDYFLDTPDAFNGTPPAPNSGADSWKDGVALPLVHKRTFNPGSTPGAEVLKDPLWYAAKWGGFQDQDKNDMRPTSLPS